MNKLLFYIILIINLIKCSTLAPDASFIDLPLNAKTGSLGNTSLSNIGDPSNIITNPANIWFGNRVNSNKGSFFENSFFRLSISNFKIFQTDNNYNAMISTQFGDKMTLGIGYIGRSENEIDNYDYNANYLGNIEFKENAFYIGGASNFGIINLGASIGLLNSNFTGDYINNNSDQSYITNTGISINNISIRSNNQAAGFISYIVKVLPNDISINFSSKNLIYDGELSNNTAYKNIFGFKGNYINNNSTTYILTDYMTNNNITSSKFSFGLGYKYEIQSKFSIGFNTGFKYVDDIEGFSYGIEFESFNGHLSIAIANIQTNWNSDYIILTLKRSYDKRGG